VIYFRSILRGPFGEVRKRSAWGLLTRSDLRRVLNAVCFAACGGIVETIQ